ncbi:MAG TPA: hypothetical protein VF765_05910 [Polyangiaceae bacterium]
MAPSKAREPTPVSLEPIAPGATIVGDFAPPGPASVLTAAMNAELAGRALHGGEQGGYAARCTLDRFALRQHASVTEGRALLALYADLSCEARRTVDGRAVWRGELRGRTCSAESHLLGSDMGTMRRLSARALSDAAREMASDLAIRALALVAEPSARVFADESEQQTTSGLDDSPFGPAALSETTASMDAAMRATSDHDPQLRAAAWNVVAMAAGPGDAWQAGATLSLDDDPLVRCVQYKALARLGSPAALQQLASATQREDDPVLSELVADAIKSGGTGLPRSHR